MTWNIRIRGIDPHHGLPVEEVEGLVHDFDHLCSSSSKNSCLLMRDDCPKIPTVAETKRHKLDQCKRTSIRTYRRNQTNQIAKNIKNLNRIYKTKRPVKIKIDIGVKIDKI